MNPQRSGALLVVVSAAAFGVTPIFAKLAYAEGVNLKTMLAVRFCIAAASLWAIWLLSRRRLRSPRPAFVTLTALVLMGGLAYVGQSFSYFTALSSLPASVTGLLLYTYPVIVVLLARLFFGERLSGVRLAALGLAGLGIGLVLDLPALLSAGNSLRLTPAGTAWGLASAAIYSGYIIAGARLAPGVDSLLSSAVITSSAAAVYLLWGASAGEVNLRLTAGGWAWCVLIALVSTVIAISTFFAGLGMIGPSRASIISTLEPAITVVAASAVLGESLGTMQLVGGALIIAAVLLLQLRAGEGS